MLRRSLPGLLPLLLSPGQAIAQSEPPPGRIHGFKTPKNIEFIRKIVISPVISVFLRNQPLGYGYDCSW